MEMNESQVPPTPDDSARKSQSWKLPEGIENHIESGIIKTFSGAIIGGVVGMLLFKSGGGSRAASTAMGVGVACGSIVERALGDSRLKRI
jgi:uncharacterized protein YcfJ